jgi:uncharacterized protein YjbI with pentapeptide repeats
MLGLRFDDCAAFGLAFSFENCTLNHSSFYKLKVKLTKFQGCSLIAVDFTETDLTQSNFAKSDLKDAVFERSNLEKCDFRTAFNYAFDPELNRIKKAKFSRDAVVGLLAKYPIEIE